MSDTHRVVVEFADSFYEALQAEAQRLDVGVEEIVTRAAAAWLIEIEENLPELKAAENPVPVG